MHPQPFPRRFLGKIRSMTRIICNQGVQNENVAAALHEILPNTRFASRDSTAIEHFTIVNGFGNCKWVTESREEDHDSRPVTLVATRQSFSLSPTLLVQARLPLLCKTQIAESFVEFAGN